MRSFCGDDTCSREETDFIFERRCSHFFFIERVLLRVRNPAPKWCGEGADAMSVMVAKVHDYHELDKHQRAELVTIYRHSFREELSWMQSQGRSTTSTLSIATAFSYIFDNKQLYLAVRVSEKYAQEAAAALATPAVPTSSWIEDVTEKSVGSNQSPFHSKKTNPVANAPVISMKVRDISPRDILGFVTIEQAYPHVDAFLRCIAVNPKAQRLGVGKFLLAFVVSLFGQKSGSSSSCCMLQCLSPAKH